MTNQPVIRRRGLLAAGAGLATVPLIGVRPARAQAPSLKIGCLTDLSGPYKDLAGPVAIACVHQALEDYGVSGKGMKVEVISADRINEAYERVLASDVRYRFVIDTSTLR